MSINKHPTKEGWWQIRYRPEGRKGKQKVITFEGTEEQAKKQEQYLRAGLWDGSYETIESSYKKLKINENRGPFVYFIQQGYSGPIKIGYTRDNLYARFKRLQTGNHMPLRIIAVIEDADIKTETELHFKFSHLRLMGEWFTPAQELTDFIQRIRSKSLINELEEMFLSYHERISELTEEKQIIALKALNSTSIHEFRKTISIIQ